MSLSFIIVAGTFTAAANTNIQADTSGGAFTITLPAAASVGDFIEIEDARLSWNSNPLTLAPNGLKINGGTVNYVASVIGNKLSVVYISAPYGWSIK